MTGLPPLDTLGRRIMIMGPTNAGKSTLAVALSQKLGIPVQHVDLFRHLPGTDWEQRPTVDFHAIHDAAVLDPKWVMDGNYSEVLPQRLARATGIIVVDETPTRRYWRYFRRTLGLSKRLGALEGNKDSIKWDMIHWLWHTRKSAAQYQRVAEQSGLPNVFIPNERALKALYRDWQIHAQL